MGFTTLGDFTKLLTTESTEEHRGCSRSWFPSVFLRVLCGEEFLVPIKTIDHALDAVAEVSDVKVDQQADMPAAEAQVGEQLGMVDEMNCFDRFHFD